MPSARRSLKLALSYVFDWIVIILIAVVGALFTLIHTNHRVFSLADPSISYPLLNDTVSVTALVLVGLLAPAAITFVVCMIFVPGPTAPKDVPKAQIWRRKLWEWNTAWLGLGLSVAMAFMITDGLKVLFGKPRPDMLARCVPDLANVNAHTVGGLGSKVLEGQYLVDYHICLQPDASVLADGFMSFPSGHSSFSWAGLGYLSLFLCAKFAIAVPYILPRKHEVAAFESAGASGASGKDANGVDGIGAARGHGDPELRALRSSAAAPPVYLIVLAFVPVAVAMYICASRFTDYKHDGFDIICGSLIGIVAAYLGFRLYHAPIRRGAGWSWGPRSSDKAFGVGIGVQSYVDEGVHNLRDGADRDLERGADRREAGTAL